MSDDELKTPPQLKASQMAASPGKKSVEQCTLFAGS